MFWGSVVYPQILEAQIKPGMGGRYYSPYTDETFKWAEDVDIGHIVGRARQRPVRGRCLHCLLAANIRSA